MKRSIKKAVEDYRRIRKGNGTAEFYATDIQQVKELATGDNGMISLYEAIGIALEAGYMIGYRTAKRHDRQKKGNA